MKHLSQRMGPITTEEILSMMVGNLIAKGTHREVYECPTFPSAVIKISREFGNLSNVLEWQIWNEMEGTKWAKWLAPCHSLSQCGTVLLMKKATALLRAPSRVPTFLADLKPGNWGMIDGKPVCIDYGNNKLFSMAIENSKLEEGGWHDGILVRK